MPSQSFDQNFVDVSAPGIVETAPPYLERMFAWGAPILLGLTFAIALINWLGQDGKLSSPEIVVCVLTTALFAWQCLPAATALLGLLTTPQFAPKQVLKNLRVAVLLPMYGEDATLVITNAVQLLVSLSNSTTHQFVLFILSDSQDERCISAEKEMFRNAIYRNPFLKIYYHNRRLNTDHKSGNIREWIEREGAAFDAMLVLDADSQMSRKSVLALTDSLAADPACGLVQSMPAVLRGDTLWQWTQHFAAKVYGRPLGIGLQRWMGNEANFYGHNAIIRTRAFAACAGLPRLRQDIGTGETIMSHDFVEAALLRRAGWGVRLRADLDESFEETPRTLVGFINRDSRWCHGNLQHLQILGAVGLHGVSRWHLFHGAMTYLSSVLWFAALVLWAGLGPIAGNASTIGLVCFVIFVLLAPKLFGIISHLQQVPLNSGFVKNLVAELVLSTLIAPTLMVHRIQTIARYAMGSKCLWLPFPTVVPGILDTLRFHAFETLVGAALLVLALTGLLSLLIVPVAISLIASSALSLIFSTKFKTSKPKS